MPNVSISINGEAIFSIISFSIIQEFNKLHEFECTFHATLYEGRSNEPRRIDQSSKILGTRIEITADELKFNGIITDVNITIENFETEIMRVKGTCPGILLESESGMYRSFVNKSLSATANLLLNQGAGSSMVKIDPVDDIPIPYLTQYNETIFAFLNRLSLTYNQLFFYDGTKFHFGAYDVQHKTVPLMVNTDTTKLNMGIRTKPLGIGRYDYRYLEHNPPIHITAGSDLAFTDALMAHAYASSSQLYKNYSFGRSEVATRDNTILKAELRARQKMLASQLVYYEGESTKTGLQLGCHANIKSSTNAAVDTILITYVKHTFDNISYYKNQFRGQKLTDVYLPSNVVFPKAEPQIATVHANNDPLLKGRVQVKFPWQTLDRLDSAENLHTDWLRIVTADAGSYLSGDENRGHVFIPEVGDQVMVGFEFGDPDLPFVFGSVFHGNNAKNIPPTLKTLTTKAGSGIAINDQRGESAVLIMDMNQNLIKINSETDSIEIEVANDLLFTCNNMRFKVKNDFIIDAVNNINFNGNNMQLNLKQDYGLNAVNINEYAQGTMNTVATNDIQLHAIAGSANLRSLDEINLAAAGPIVNGTGESMHT